MGEEQESDCSSTSGEYSPETETAMSHLSSSILPGAYGLQGYKESSQRRELLKKNENTTLDNESEGLVFRESRVQNPSLGYEGSNRDLSSATTPSEEDAAIGIDQHGTDEQKQGRHNESVSVVAFECCSYEQEVFLSPQRKADNGEFIDGATGIGESHGGSVLSPIPLSQEAKRNISPELLVRGTLHKDGKVSIDGTKIVEESGERDVSLVSEHTSSPRHELNDSVNSSGSLREDKIMKTQKELGATSHAFIERLRGAAHRRKMNLARSRDDLAAKEREQREAIAASKARQSEQIPVVQPERRKTMPARPEPAVTAFKARPLPKTNGWQGSGYGVPKVEKKQVTIPLSPLLGARRQLRRMIGKPETKPAMAESTGDTPNQFRARPLPKVTGNSIKVGHWGLLKLPKRPVTVPQSPLLGHRRKQQTTRLNYVQNEPSLAVVLNCSADTTNKSTASDVRSVPSSGSLLSQSSQALLGLEVLSCKGKENDSTGAVEAMTSSVSTDKPNGGEIAKSIVTGYQPHSTCRAKERAAFEAKRIVLEQQRKEQERAERQKQVLALRRELSQLRDSF